MLSLRSREGQGWGKACLGRLIPSPTPHLFTRYRQRKLSALSTSPPT